jgi:hypothetical protein
MIRFLLVSVTGWAAVLATGTEAALPYILRNALRNSAPRASAGGLPVRLPSLRVRMWPHYWIGYALVVMVLVHTSFVTGPVMGRSDATGIWAATLALCLLFLQVGLGLILRSETKSGTSTQRQVRRWHFWTMTGFIGLVLTHVSRNG